MFKRTIAIAAVFAAAIVMCGWAASLSSQSSMEPTKANPRIISSCPSGVKIVQWDVIGFPAGRFEVVGRDGQRTVPFLLDYTNEYRDMRCDQPIQAIVFGTAPDPYATGQYGYISLDGRLLQGGLIFERTSPFQDGYAAVKLGGKWGVIDMAGTFTVRPKFDRLRPISQGQFYAVIDGDGLSINADGSERPRPSPLDCGGGGGYRIVHAQRAGEARRTWGIADSSGKILVEPKHRAIDCWIGLDLKAWVPDVVPGQWCVIGQNGERADPWTCVTTPEDFIIRERAVAIYEQFHSDPHESSVLWTSALLEFAIGERPRSPKVYIREFGE